MGCVVGAPDRENTPCFMHIHHFLSTSSPFNCIVDPCVPFNEWVGRPIKHGIAFSITYRIFVKVWVRTHDLQREWPTR